MRLLNILDPDLDPFFLVGDGEVVRDENDLIDLFGYLLSPGDLGFFNELHVFDAQPVKFFAYSNIRNYRGLKYICEQNLFWRVLMRDYQHCFNEHSKDWLRSGF